ncbi:nitrogenase cofactor biosynthesis protein NifB [Thermocrinis albus DSM 14484]|uniref:FeMo cofactor biosynthesis protein NifB n=1 Tax=Thermocrinis albus (strain DSM 14484 / JCM 11386 / HI 11/12) TaxID=638303 RepID=D3SPG1_THEAH|nr:nitrogenase cofactor biosynthesis protein NifB [Thermocrinis albus]ADC89048.1 nitrogenase cofactor biosynthesis protein NifB [Thermocrinis albus DSM 14484]
MSGCHSKQCGLGSDDLSFLPEDIRRKVENHPCYSQEAHHFYARMHVAVAPACNIQCNYCNRKYDCANESRPGVVSELLTPEEAAKKVLAVAMEIPQLTVVGIAGPGDPLANPERTFRTFELIKEKAPDIKLCLSTNGLVLDKYINKIKDLEIDHVTITINAVSVDTASKIYPWIFYNHRRYRDKEAAKILLEKQYEGLQACVENGILVKVNTVFVPEINGEEIPELSKKVRSMGAFLHNIMPYVEGEGTAFSKAGIRPPTPQELKEMQEKCEGNMNLMRHCRQCRADAIGLLGEDRGQEFTKDKLSKININYDPNWRKQIHEEIEKEREKLRKARELLFGETENEGPKVLVAVASKGNMLVNEHFGTAKEFLIYEVSAKGAKFIHHRKVTPYCHGSISCLEGENILEDTIAKLSDCKAIIAAKIGFEPRDVLKQRNIDCVDEFAYLSIDEALARYYKKYVLKEEVPVGTNGG